MNKYLQKQGLFSPLIPDAPQKGVKLIVVLPCHDEPDLISALASLRDCILPDCPVEVIVVINQSADCPETIHHQNQQTYHNANAWAAENSIPYLRFFPLWMKDLPPKHAGVGLARKIGMDEAVRRFDTAGQTDGVILCYDADSRCLPNYFTEVDLFFKERPKLQACSIRFEHPLEGNEYPESVYRSIILYELHLRYYIQAQRFTGYPFAFQTIGSSMAVRALAYQQQGGMNRRKAGEDFYFLHKFIPLGHFAELNTTCVIPSPRPSDRVPFGTGKAVNEILNQESEEYLTYAPPIFRDLKAFLANVHQLYTVSDSSAYRHWFDALPESIQQFLTEVDFEKWLNELQTHTASRPAFEQRFYRWFNAFRLMKYVHFARDQFYPSIPVQEAANWLLSEAGHPNMKSAKAQLLRFREIDYG